MKYHRAIDITSLFADNSCTFSNFYHVYLPRWAITVDVERETEYCNKLCIIQQQSVQRNILIITVSINNDSIF